MRGEADPALMRRQPEGGAHRPAHPWIRRRLKRPAAFVQPAEDQPVGALEPGLQHTPDLQPRVAAVMRPDDPAPHQRVQQIGPGASVDRAESARGAAELVHEAGRRRAVVVRPQALGAARLRARRQPLGGLDLRRGQLGDRGPSAAPDQRVERRHRPGDGVEPCAKHAVLADGPYQTVGARGGAGAPERRAFQPANPGAERAGLHPAGGERVLEDGKQRHRRPALGERPGEQAEKRARRSERERPAAGIVDLHAPAEELRRDPPGEPAVGSHQRRRLARALQRLAEQQRDRRRLLPRTGAIDPADAVQRGGAGGRVERRRPGSRRTHGGGEQAGPGLGGAAGLGARPQRDVARVDPELVEDEVEAVLRVAGIERVPHRGFEPAVEPGQDHGAAGEPGHRRHQGARRRQAPGRTGEDHPPRRRVAAPGLDAGLDQPVAAFGRADRAFPGEHRGPGIGEDAKEIERDPPVRGERLRRQPREPVEAEPFRLHLVEQARELEGEAGDARGLLSALFGADELGEEELAAQRRDRRRQLERGGGHVVGLEFLVETGIADRQDRRQQERALRAGAQHRLAERPACPPVGQQHRRPGGGASALLVQQSAGQRVEKGNPGGDREDPRPRGFAARHPTWKSCAPGRPSSRSSAVLSAPGVPIWNHSPSCTTPNSRPALCARS